MTTESSTVYEPYIALYADPFHPRPPASSLPSQADKTASALFQKQDLSSAAAPCPPASSLPSQADETAAALFQKQDLSSAAAPREPFTISLSEFQSLKKDFLKAAEEIIALITLKKVGDKTLIEGVMFDNEDVISDMTAAEKLVDEGSTGSKKTQGNAQAAILMLEQVFNTLSRQEHLTHPHNVTALSELMKKISRLLVSFRGKPFRSTMTILPNPALTFNRTIWPAPSSQRLPAFPLDARVKSVICKVWGMGVIPSGPYMIDRETLHQQWLLGEEARKKAEAEAT